MTVVTAVAVQKKTLFWWDYASYLALAIFFPLVFTGSPLALGIAIHLFCDFSAQSNFTAMNKGNKASPSRYKALIVHSLCAAIGSALACGMTHGTMGFLVGAAIGFASHLAIDSCNKFNLPVVPGLVVDQALHLIFILVLI